MPGAGGNFMVRVLEQGHHEELITQAQYPEQLHGDRRRPTQHNWLHTERPWMQTDHYEHNHMDNRPWLRITVTTAQEWHWSCANALWKNSQPDAATGPQFQASTPDLPATHHITLESLWHWHTLEPQLESLQGHAANPHQRLLHEQWRLTWCPHTDQAQYQATCHRLFDPHRPAHIR